MKIVFNDKTTCMLRFPRGGKIPQDYIDEKVAIEVEALNIIREKTTVPVLKVHVWGRAADNILGLGPFILMDFINGVSLSDIIVDPQASEPTRLMRDDIRDEDIEFIYRQFANILLQIFQIDFEKIGNLPPRTPNGTCQIPQWPLTFKAHSILKYGGVDTFGDPNQGFTTTTEYLEYLIEQDVEQLYHQPNSTAGKFDAEAKLKALKVLQSLVTDFVNPEYDCGKFKLMCDDLGLANLIVKSKDDLTIVGVVDLEWSYSGPAQLAASAPWWLLQDRLVNPDWDCPPWNPPSKVVARYFRYLDIFTCVLEEEEAKLFGPTQKEFSDLVKWSQVSGTMWVHMLLAQGFIDQYSFPFTQLRKHLGEKWTERLKIVTKTEEIERFTAQKERDLREYDEILEKMRADEKLVGSGKMSQENFLAAYAV